MRFIYQYQGQIHTLDLTVQPDGQYTVVIGERSVPIYVQPIADGGYRLNIEGVSHTVHAAAEKDRRFVQVDADTFMLTVPATQSKRHKSAANGDALVAQMPGQVTAILAHDGDSATRGQTLLILEAMKMEIRVVAPADGYVRQMLVEQGTVVERAQRLVVFDSSPD